MKKTVYAFDFDGTITTKDTFLEFIKHSVGKAAFWGGLLRCAPSIAGMKLGLVSTQRAKEKLFAHFFKGMELSRFDELCVQFAEQKQNLIRPQARAELERLCQSVQNSGKNMQESPENAATPEAVSFLQNAQSSQSAPVLDGGANSVLIVSASIENYVKAFFPGLPIIVEATKLQIDDSGRLTGTFLGNNCKNQEKVNRVLLHFPERSEYTLVSYGDSSGDRELFDFSDEHFYKPFRENSGSIAEKIRFLFVGGIATLISYGLYNLFLLKLNANVSFTLSYIISLCANFVLSTLFTFRVKPNARRALGFLFSHIVNYTLQFLFLRLFIWLGVPERIAPIPDYAICVPINYFLVRFFLKKLIKD